MRPGIGRIRGPRHVPTRLRGRRISAAVALFRRSRGAARRRTESSFVDSVKFAVRGLPAHGCPVL